MTQETSYPSLLLSQHHPRGPQDCMSLGEEEDSDLSKSRVKVEARVLRIVKVLRILKIIRILKAFKVIE